VLDALLSLKHCINLGRGLCSCLCGIFHGGARSITGGCAASTRVTLLAGFGRARASVEARRWWVCRLCLVEARPSRCGGGGICHGEALFVKFYVWVGRKEEIVGAELTGGGCLEVPRRSDLRDSEKHIAEITWPPAFCLHQLLSLRRVLLAPYVGNFCQ